MSTWEVNHLPACNTSKQHHSRTPTLAPRLSFSQFHYHLLATGTATFTHNRSYNIFATETHRTYISRVTYYCTNAVVSSTTVSAGHSCFPHDMTAARKGSYFFGWHTRPRRLTQGLTWPLPLPSPASPSLVHQHDVIFLALVLILVLGVVLLFLLLEPSLYTTTVPLKCFGVGANCNGGFFSLPSTALCLEPISDSLFLPLRYYVALLILCSLTQRSPSSAQYAFGGQDLHEIAYRTPTTGYPAHKNSSS